MAALRSPFAARRRDQIVLVEIAGRRARNGSAVIAMLRDLNRSSRNAVTML
jgi:hypothetical protein